MIKNYLICFLFLSAISTSCCKKKQVIPTIRITYPQLEIHTTFNIDRYFDPDSIRRTESFSLLEDAAPYFYPLQVNDYDSFFIVDVYAISFDSSSVDSSLIYSDTIRNVQYELKGNCNTKLTGFSYEHNGVFKTETSILK